ncbi:hypothetical protein [Martelella sp. HB161492]|uniref:hypothetical protein n=1 Tax=Martelella sp. HB161492 TaxID=2720726 RepID=UPI00159122C3|nr:hypothetical protein [Martelella sp. HB161492]
MNITASLGRAAGEGVSGTSSGIGYIDLDHVVLTVPNLSDAVSALFSFGLVAAPPQLAGRSDDCVPGVRHLVFETVNGHDDVANMIVLSQPGPPAPVLVAASPDLEATRLWLEGRGLDNGASVSVPDRTWLDPTDGSRQPIRASRLSMSPSAPMMVNATHADAIATYHRAGFHRHHFGIRRMAGVSIVAPDGEGVCNWLAEILTGSVAQLPDGSFITLTRDCFLRVLPAPEGAIGPVVTGITFEVDDAERYIAALNPKLRGTAEHGDVGEYHFNASPFPGVAITFADVRALDVLRGH